MVFDFAPISGDDESGRLLMNVVLSALHLSSGPDGFTLDFVRFFGRYSIRTDQPRRDGVATIPVVRVTEDAFRATLRMTLRQNRSQQSKRRRTKETTSGDMATSGQSSLSQVSLHLNSVTCHFVSTPDKI